MHTQDDDASPSLARRTLRRLSGKGGEGSGAALTDAKGTGGLEKWVASLERAVIGSQRGLDRKRPIRGGFNIQPARR